MKIGNILFDFFDKSELNIAIVISSDLAHTHKADYMPYGYSKYANIFDNYI